MGYCASPPIFKKLGWFATGMRQQRELRFLLAITAVGLFSLSVYNAVFLTDPDSASTAYRSVTTAAFAFVWGMVCWLSYEDPLRYREAIMVTVMGLVLISMLEVTLIMSSHVPQGVFNAPWGQQVSLADALWGEATVLVSLGLLIFYFRPTQPIIEMKILE